MNSNIHDVAVITAEEVMALNFINLSPACHLRRYFRQGLRSHIFEVLDVCDVSKETQGELSKGVRWFPRAVPQKMLRILRTRFSQLSQALDEVNKYTMILKFLGPEFIAVSQEFIVEYHGANGSEIILCGLQEYVQGKALDPWDLSGDNPIDIFFQRHFPGQNSGGKSVKKAIESISFFVKKVKRMAMDEGYIPDLAGNGNLIITARGELKLVDINNIIKVHYNEKIFLDDKKYPSCDKSVEVLAILEQKVMKNKFFLDGQLYRHFFSTERRQRVKELEEKFYQNW
ncbi:hypothetical protein [Desulfocicer vacuolatum]|nr:hypothetical protein [Desulfocicer vacuolatum]